MSWEVFPIGEQLLVPTAQALADAFADDPLFAFLAGNEDALRRWLPVAQEANLRMTLPDGHTYGLRTSEGEVAGGMCLLPPDRFPVSIGRNLAFLWTLITRPNPWTPALARGLRRSRPYLDAWEAMHVREPHWYLYDIGVARAHQGRGGGQRLMAHAFELAAADGLPIYLETQTEANLGFYRHMGFELVDRRRPHPEGPPTWGLLHRGEPE